MCDCVRCGRMLPVWVLMPAQVLHSVSHYVISSMVRTVWLQLLKATHREYQRLTVRQENIQSRVEL